jgi:hypothetical protein
MYGMNKKAYKPVGGGMRVQKPMAPNSGSGMGMAAAQDKMKNAMMRKRVLRNLRGA